MSGRPTSIESDLQGLRSQLYNWYRFYAGDGLGDELAYADFNETLDAIFYPFVWLLFRQGTITAEEMVALGGYAEDLGACLKGGAVGKINILIVNEVMGIGGHITLDPAVLPEYAQLCDREKDELVNHIFLAISGSLGFHLFAERFAARNGQGEEKH